MFKRKYNYFLGYPGMCSIIIEFFSTMRKIDFSNDNNIDFQNIICYEDYIQNDKYDINLNPIISKNDETLTIIIFIINNICDKEITIDDFESKEQKSLFIKFQSICYLFDNEYDIISHLEKNKEYLDEDNHKKLLWYKLMIILYQLWGLYTNNQKFFIDKFKIYVKRRIMNKELIYNQSNNNHSDFNYDMFQKNEIVEMIIMFNSLLRKKTNSDIEIISLEEWENKLKCHNK